MKKLISIVFLFAVFKGFSQSGNNTTPLLTKPMSSYDIYTGSQDSTKFLSTVNGITKNVFGVDVIRKAVKYGDTAGMKADLRAWVNAQNFGSSTSFAGRTGTIVPQLSDYASFYAALSHGHKASQITDFDSSVSANSTVAANTAHAVRTDNPHGVTAAQIGLGLANNTSDANKPISTATQTALNAKASVQSLIDSANNIVSRLTALIANISAGGDSIKLVVDPSIKGNADSTNPLGVNIKITNTGTSGAASGILTSQGYTINVPLYTPSSSTYDSITVAASDPAIGNAYISTADHYFHYRIANKWYRATIFDSVTMNAPPVASNVTLIGTPNVGNSLSTTFTYTDAESDPQGSSIKKYYSYTTTSGTAQVLLATASTYTIQSTDIGKYIRSSVTPVASAGTPTGVEVFSGYSSQVAGSSSTTVNPSDAITDSTILADDTIMN